MSGLTAQVAAVDGWLAGLPTWQAFLVVVGASVFAAGAIHVGGDRVVRRLTPRIPGEVDDVVLARLHPAIWVSVLLVGTSIGLARLDVLDTQAGLLRAGTITVVAVIWAVTAIRLGRDVSEAVTDTGYVDRQVVPIFQNVWAAVVGLGAVFVVLSVWRIDVTPLLASAGIAGIVVGLAAKDTMANFFGSLSLYADGTYTVGDYVVLSTGERGRVEDVSIRSTVIRTRDDILVTVPNASLSSDAVVNESTPTEYRRIRLPVGVAYGTDLDRVEELLLKIADAEELIRDHPSPRVRFREFGDSALQVELLAWIDSPRLRGRATDRLGRATYEAFREADVEIPYPQRSLHLSDAENGVVSRPSDEPATGEPSD